MENIGLFTCSKTFSKTEYAQDFLKGNLRFMPLNYYTDLEGDSREDRYEGVSLLHQPHLSEFEINGIKLDSDNLAGPILVRHNKDNAHIFCMSAFYNKDTTKSFKTEKEFLNNISKPCKFKLLTFGNITVLIINIIEFFNRVDNAVKKNKLCYKRKLVKYVSLNEFHGKIKEPGFIKDLNYENESEFRFALKDLPNEPFILSIGDISDIATILETNEMDKFSVSFKDEKL